MSAGSSASSASTVSFKVSTVHAMEAIIPDMVSATEAGSRSGRPPQRLNLPQPPVQLVPTRENAAHQHSFSCSQRVAVGSTGIQTGHRTALAVLRRLATIRPERYAVRESPAIARRLTTPAIHPTLTTNLTVPPLLDHDEVPSCFDHIVDDCASVGRRTHRLTDT
jgi:hypothetical protein